MCVAEAHISKNVGKIKVMNRIQTREKERQKEKKNERSEMRSMMIKDDENALVMQTHQSQKG